MDTLLQTAEERIKAGYAELGHNQGWSFLYTPRSTLRPENRFLFMGLNPGGCGNSDTVSLATEKGNAYHPEVENDWLGNGQPAPLQMQVVAFYEMLKEQLGHDTRQLMDSTLAANFCPFRSPSWSDLNNRDATINFSYRLWADLFQELRLTTIVCMSRLVFEKMGAIAGSAGGQETCCVSEYVGWGRVQYRYKKYKIHDRELLLLCLPHLSRFRIFSSGNCSSQAKKIVDMVSASLKGWIP